MPIDHRFSLSLFLVVASKKRPRDATRVSRTLHDQSRVAANSIRTLSSLSAPAGLRKRSTFCPLARPFVSPFPLLFFFLFSALPRASGCPTAVISLRPRRNAALADTLLSIPIRAAARSAVALTRLSRWYISLTELCEGAGKLPGRRRRSRQSGSGEERRTGERGLEEGKRGGSARAEVEEDRNKLGTSRLPAGVLPETSPGDLQRGNGKICRHEVGRP